MTKRISVIVVAVVVVVAGLIAAMRFVFFSPFGIPLQKIFDGNPELRQINSSYFSGNRYIYYRPATTREFTRSFIADIATFVIVTDPWIAKDKNAVYDRGSILEGADAATFVGLNGGYGKDQSAVYYYFYTEYSTDSDGKRIVGADPETFALIPSVEFYAKDKNAVYYTNKKISDDPQHFQVIGSEYVRDSKTVFYRGNSVPNVEAATFIIFPPGNFSKDARRVYFQGEVIQDADPATFQPRAGTTDKPSAFCLGQDKDYLYQFTRRTSLHPDQFVFDNQKNYCNRGFTIFEIP